MKGAALCPFCRTPTCTTEKELVKQTMKRIEHDNDSHAMFNLGCNYDYGEFGLPQNRAKGLEFWHRASELGHSGAYYNVGYGYHVGNGVERDLKKAQHYWELAAMGGDDTARNNLGLLEKKDGNMDRALKHFMISAMGGLSGSLNSIQELFMHGHATKDDYAKALRAHQAYLDEIRSDQRDEAAALDKYFKYY